MSFFRFLRFDVHQGQCAHRVGTDAMLLGAWTRAGKGRILDVGTGSGVLALMLAQRSDQAEIDAIEPDRPSAAQASENVAASPWPERIRIQPCRLQDWAPDYCYDLIVCNPPYFDELTQAKGEARHLARHSASLSREALIRHAQRLLAPGGRLALVLPLAYGDELIALAGQSGLYPQRSCVVRHSPTHAPKRLLIELGKQQAASEAGSLAIRDLNGLYSADYRALTSVYHSLAPPLEYDRARARAQV